MCLRTIKSVKIHKKVGWKVLIIRHEGSKTENSLYETPYQGSVDNYIPAGEWVHEKDYRVSLDMNGEKIQSDRDGSYVLGFHIYKRKSDAMIWHDNLYRVCKVEFDEVVATGTEIDRDSPYSSDSDVSHEVEIIVARRIRIIKEEKP